ncbi:MAG: ParB/RepB/Spo0J family partition protein [Pseudomonadota bacterium]|nr:ParB/RepB/Spo0J family partition protein [Pseudomonadota bacterium]
MRMPWITTKVEQLDLIDEPKDWGVEALAQSAREKIVDAHASAPSTTLALDELTGEGRPLLVSTGCVDEDPNNPRTEFPDEEIAELAHDIALRGILQPIVVHPLGDGRYRVLFGARRLRAAKQAGLEAVPVVIGLQAHDVYAQVAENQKRHGLTSLDLARFMRTRVDSGESNAEIAKRMAIDQTTVAHYLALLTLPPELDEALRTGRCTSPRTLYELARLHEKEPDKVRSIVVGRREITRHAVASLKKTPRPKGVASPTTAASPRRNSLADQASRLCTRLESLFGDMTRTGAPVKPDELATLRRRLAVLAGR